MTNQVKINTQQAGLSSSQRRKFRSRCEREQESSTNSSSPSYAVFPPKLPRESRRYPFGPRALQVSFHLCLAWPAAFAFLHLAGLAGSPPHRRHPSSWFVAGRETRETWEIFWLPHKQWLVIFAAGW